MGNYKLYFVLSAIFFGSALSIILCSDLSRAGFIWLLGLIQIPLGLLQLISGLELFLKRKNYPEPLQRSIGNYWKWTGGYALVLILLSHLASESAYLVFWLFGAPWAIAIFQLQLVYRFSLHKKLLLNQRGLQNNPKNLAL